MDRLRNVGSSICGFGRSVVEWRSPATAPYLLVINTAFWLTALYCDSTIQLRALLSLAIGVFSWDVLLTPSHDRSILIHVLLWPIQSIFRTSAVLISLYSAHVLRKDELEAACIAAYSTVLCLLVNPVWNYYQITEKILDGCTSVAHQTAHMAKWMIVEPSLKVWAAIKYVVLLQFIPPLWQRIKSGFTWLGTKISNCWTAIINWFKNLGSSIANWISENIIEPTKRRLYAIGRFFRYWLCAHWWPDLKQWIIINIGGPLQRLFNYICFGFVYIVCGHWLPPLGRFLHRQLCRFGSFLHRTLIVPIKIWLLARFDELHMWSRRFLHRLALAIRDSILWPICILVVETGKELSLLVYRILLKPVLNYFYERYKILETVALVYLLGPVCETIVNNIPEKSPFCDDSDVELEGMLPEETSEHDDQIESNASDSLDELIPDSPMEEEHEFASGLAFPTIHASESSDEEFDLQKTRERQPVRRRKKKIDTVGDSEHSSRSSHHRHDDEFELLQ